MKKIWNFVRQPQNLAVLVALAGALAFLWKEVRAPKPAAGPAAVQQQATAQGGGTAVNAAGQSQVTIGTGASIAPGASAPGGAASQAASAGAGGVAVNADGAARVTVTQGAGAGK